MGDSVYSFGNWIKRRRKVLDLTQEELARRVGCSTSTIFKIEGDERRPSRQIAELLARDLEIPPDQRDLFLKVARQEKQIGGLEGVPALAETASVPVAALPQKALPVFPTTFVGREHEIERITAHLLDPSCRLLTLTGPGGVGKSRLAVEAARRLQPNFPEGVFFISMAGVSLPESILPTLARGLGIVFSGPADPGLQVVQRLRNKKMLVLVDNMEHLVTGSGVLAELLEQALDFKLLLTSREPVHLQWEWVFTVQGLPVPQEASLESLQHNSAASLFLQRASQIKGDYSIQSEQVPALVRICTAVEGLPLAIELAASWVTVMSLERIADELEHSLDLLATHLQDVPDRHRSMGSVFDHSWKLLTTEEQSVFLKLCVFSGGFTRSAACKATDASIPVLASLEGKSLLHYSSDTERYHLHELTRQYALVKLHELPVMEMSVFERYSQHYSGWLARREGSLKSAKQIQTSAQLRAETGNWLSAWRWAVRERKLNLLRQMLPCLYWYYEIHGYYAEALSAYKTAVEALRAAEAPGSLITAEDKSTFAFLVDQQAWFEFRTGNLSRAAALFAESLELARECSDPVVLYHIHGNWGYMCLLNGDINEARRLTLESLENARQVNSQWYYAVPANVLGIVELLSGNLQGAYQQLTDILEVWREVGDPRGLVFCMLYLSSTALALGKVAEAEGLLNESNRMAVKKMDRWAQAYGLDLLGQVSGLKGETESARERFEHSLRLYQEIGDQWGSTQSLIHLGEVRAASGLNDEVQGLFQEAYENAFRAKWIPTIVEVLAASLHVTNQLPPETRLAACLSCLAHPAVTPHVRQRVERLCEKVTLSLSPGQVEMAQELAAEKTAEMWAQQIFNK